MRSVLRLGVRDARIIAVARAVHALVFAGTGLYCLLIFSPFTFQQFIRPQVSAGLAALALWHTSLCALALAISALTIAPYLEARRAVRAAGWAYLGATGAIVAWFALARVVVQPDPARSNLAYALLAFVPPAVLGLFDHLAADAPPLAPARDGRSAAACWRTAACVWAAFGAGALLRLQTSGALEPTAGRALAGVIASLFGHGTIFAMLWLALASASGAAALARAPGRVEYILVAGLAACTAGAVASRLVLAPLSIAGPASWGAAAAIGATAAVVWSGVARHRCGQARWPDPPTALDMWCAPIATRRSGIASAGGVVLALAMPQVLIATVAAFDWDFMVQKLGALAAWVLVFAFVHAAAREPRGSRPLWMAPGAILLILAADSAVRPRVAAAWSGGAASSPESESDAYAALDPSYRVVRDALRPGDPDDALAFYAYLRANTGVAGAGAQPAPIDFVSDLQPAAAPPHVFLFVVDSLRRDYLSPYSPAVTFTPAIGAFAGDSFVFTRAFTRYGGTGLAVPSIWAGGLLLHKEYVEPFAPMNALKRLAEAKGYRQFVADDHISRELFLGGDEVRLASGVTEMQHGFCSTVDEMMAAIAGDAARGDRPIFGHMRTLDLHIGNIWGAGAPPGEAYPGFVASYAARVRSIDGCFGRFLAFLRERHLYDHSVIVLTADHGDSLGEEGRWGHGFTAFPEVMRIPLIVHLPAALRRDVAADLSRVSFATDITPTLYALLGEAPRDLGPQFGSPLFAAGAGLVDRRREAFLIASSYGPTWGLIQDNGRSLFIADATHGRDYAFDLLHGEAGRRVAIAAADRAANHRRIRDEVATLAARYHFTPPP
ncbi:MAG: sulfatase-like hydrolase/transferase [Acidobacteria bacterium]|nr:sulfatase-like hydrolase/transferase [Acidobacteriota bacterium]